MELKPRQVKHGNKTSGSERTALHSIRATRIKQVQQGSGLRLADVITTKCIILLVFFVNFCLDYIGMYSYLSKCWRLYLLRTSIYRVWHGYGSTLGSSLPIGHDRAISPAVWLVTHRIKRSWRGIVRFFQRRVAALTDSYRPAYPQLHDFWLESATAVKKERPVINSLSPRDIKSTEPIIFRKIKL